MDFYANWISNNCRKYGSTPEIGVGNPSPYFRKIFKVTKEISSATLTITAKGIYEAYLNGREISEDVFAPGWTNYSKMIQYQCYDVTHLLENGENCIGVILGDGWYAGHIGFKREIYYDGYPLELFVQLEITYADNSHETIISDESFTTGSGKIAASDLLDGEWIDNRLNCDGFSTVGFDDSGWKNAVIEPSSTHLLVAQKDEGIRYQIELPGTLLDETSDLQIYDFGQNFAGIIQAKIRGTKGAKIQFRHGEMLDGDKLYTENLRLARATDTFICSGEGIEEFRPLFTFHGFRYAEISVLEGTAEIFDVIGFVCYNALEPTGEFSCSNELINRIYQNTLWSNRGNFISIPTDCPQRDERLGWTADAQIFSLSAMYNFDCRKFFSRFMRDMRLDQSEDGCVPDIIPSLPIIGGGNNAWSDAIVIIPYHHYLMYRDREILTDNIIAMKKWIGFQQVNSDQLIRPDEGYGDWLSVDDEMNKSVMNTAYFAYSTKLVSEICDILNDPDAEKYRELYERIKERYLQCFVSEDYTITGDTQTTYLTAIAFGLVDTDKIKGHLLRTIERKDFHLSTGFIGVRFLLPVLCDIGRSDIAYQIILNKTYPSWGYSIENGATTIWERWNSYTIEDGFGNVEMNSFNHYSLGSCVEWMYRYILGIQCLIDDAGFERVIIHPFVDPLNRITEAKGSYISKKGRISVRWENTGGLVQCWIEKVPGLPAKYIFDGEIVECRQNGKEVLVPDENASYTYVKYRL